MAVSYFSEEDALESHQTVETYFAVFGHDYQVSIIISEFEVFHHVVYHYLVLDHERLCVVNINAVAIFTKQTELLV